jgi:hypothetical protein
LIHLKNHIFDEFLNLINISITLINTDIKVNIENETK